VSERARREAAADRRGGRQTRGEAAPPAVHRFALAVVAATFVLLTAGGLVTSTDSGLAVPDWPLSYGTLFPPMVGGILYEHGHRMIATAVGFLTLLLAGALLRWEGRAWVRRLGILAGLAVIAQGLLGGLTVLFLLPVPISVAHACVAQAFLCLVVTIAAVTAPGWSRDQALGRTSLSAREAGQRVASLAMVTTAAIYLQLILGAVTRHTGSGLAIPDFPLALGRIVPPLHDPRVALHFAHRLGALAVVLLVARTASRALAGRRPAPPMALPAGLLLVLTVIQVLLGATTVWTKLAVAPATAHVTTGAALLATSLVLTLRAGRLAGRLALPERASEATLDRLEPVVPSG
jgi:heme a synthase